MATAGREKVRQWRRDNGVSLEVLSAQLGYSGHAMLSRWENGERDMSIPRLCRLEKITGIPAEELAGPGQWRAITMIRRGGAR